MNYVLHLDTRTNEVKVEVFDDEPELDCDVCGKPAYECPGCTYFLPESCDDEPVFQPLACGDYNTICDPIGEQREIVHTICNCDPCRAKAGI